jgi:hydrogenase/urease accessory protein HupE
MSGPLRQALVAILALILALILASPLFAHEMTMAELELRETAPGEFLWHWTATNELASNRDLKPLWPPACKTDENFLRCGPAGLQGSLAMEGLGKGYSAALVKVFWRDGQSRVYTLTSAQPSVQLYGAADDQRGRGQIASAYLMLGVEHILSGFDHLLFVIGLLFLVGFKRRLLLTVTAFTAAHSVTLGLGALGLLTLRAPPVEALIAMSIMLVAGEALRERQTLSRRWPALVAFAFGLLHGLGFAGALKEIGLPDNHLWVALLTFNVGVEAGQLLTVGAAWLVYRALRQLPVMPPARQATLYAIGTLAAFWSITRSAAIFS